MKFKSGDAVRFLNDTGGGVVNRTDAQGKVYVMTDDGFEIPVRESELVPAGNFSLKPTDETEKVRVEEKPAVSRNPVPEKRKEQPEVPVNVLFDAPAAFCIGFVPATPGPVFSSDLDCYLINDSAFLAYYHMGIRESGSFRYLSSGTLEPETKCFVRTFSQTAISRISDVHVQFILVCSGKYRKRETIDKLIDLKLVNFSKESYYRENDFFEERALIFNIDGGAPKTPVDLPVPEAVIREKEMADNPAERQLKKKENGTDTLEVDLHAAALILQDKSYTPSEILAMQLSRFHSAVEEALGRRLRRLVIIHGMGQGTLKMQIRKELQEKYPEFVYQDASFKEYGFGATMVYLTIEKQQ